MTQEVQHPPAPRTATLGEVRAAIDTMSEDDEKQIMKAAVFHLAKLWARGSRSVHELIDEATDRLADGQRTWYREKDKLVTVISGTMRSIVSEWNEDERRLFSASEEAADVALVRGRVRGAIEPVDLERQAISDDLIHWTLAIEQGVS